MVSNIYAKPYMQNFPRQVFTSTTTISCLQLQLGFSLRILFVNPHWQNILEHLISYLMVSLTKNFQPVEDTFRKIGIARNQCNLKKTCEDKYLLVHFLAQLQIGRSLRQLLSAPVLSVKLFKPCINHAVVYVGTFYCMCVYMTS